MSAERKLAESEAREKALVERLNQSRKALGYAMRRLEDKGIDCGCDLSVNSPCESHAEVELARETILKNSSNERRALDLEKWRTIEDYKRSIYEALAGKMIEFRNKKKEAKGIEITYPEYTQAEFETMKSLVDCLFDIKREVVRSIFDLIRTVKNPFGETE